MSSCILHSPNHNNHCRKVSPGDDMEKQRGGDHDELIEEFEYLTTDPDGILRVLEGILGQFEAKRLLSVLFQVYAC